MGYHPNTILIASIRPPSGQPDEFLTALDPKWEDNMAIKLDQLSLARDDYYSIVVGNDADQVIFPSEDSFAVYAYLTCGWGGSITLEEFDAKVAQFKTLVQNFCDLHKCTHTITLTANFW